MRFFRGGIAKWLPLAAVLLLLISALVDAAAIPTSADSTELVQRNAEDKSKRAAAKGTKAAKPTKAPKTTKAATPTSLVKSTKAPATTKSAIATHASSVSSAKPSTSPPVKLSQPTVDEVKKYFVSGKDAAIFWCGRVNGKSVGDASVTYAQSRKPTKGITAQQLFHAATKDKAWKADWTTLGNNNDDTVWRTFSKAFALGAKGNIEIFWGDCQDPNGGLVWQEVEYPTIKKNKAITGLEKVNGNDPTQKTPMPFR